MAIADIIRVLKTQRNVAVPDDPRHQEQGETIDAKLATYAALAQINEGFTNIVDGLKTLKAAAVIAPALSGEQIDWRIKEARGFQAILNNSITNALSQIETNDSLKYRTETQKTPGAAGAGSA